MSNNEQVSHRINAITAKLPELAGYIEISLTYIETDPQSSLTKCRIVLEKVLNSTYKLFMNKEPGKTMIGNILSDKSFSGKIPKRVLARMNYIRELANLGAHGDEVNVDDVQFTLLSLVEVVEWYIIVREKVINQNISLFDNSARKEILPELLARFPNYLKKNIISVVFGQTKYRCFLETTTSETGIYDEISRRIDLGFIAGEKLKEEGSDDYELYFKPELDISENIEKFLNDFDEISIINCTDLFADDASTSIYKYYQEYGKIPPREG